MKARPILFSAPMMRALRSGKKHQTRRIMKPQPLREGPLGLLYMDETGRLPICPYGKKFDLLWVRETWALCSRATDIAKIYYRAHANNSHTEFHEFVPVEEIGNAQPTWPRWKPAIHMPKWASRTTLTITNVRAQRLQDISSDDAIAEGVECTEFHDPAVCNAVDEYRQLWESINGKGSWDANPWVWALTFMVHKQNVEGFL